ncbi:MAG: glycosyltransferase family 2 protein [Candidatus Saccharibacteria bacterium]
MAGAFLPFLHQIEKAFRAGPVIAGLVMISTLFVAYFWLNGLKDLVYTFYFYRHRQDLLTTPERGIGAVGAAPRVAMVYCTCNDFDGTSLLRSMQQDYDNAFTVILDDSQKPEYIKKVNDFSARHGVPIVRRKTHEGFKAGNLNHFLKRVDFDYFVILDSDEIIPREFISRALDYFAAYNNAGIIQANHIATRNRNRFMRTYAMGVDSHWATYQAVKDYHGFLSLLGHGAMVSRTCYEAAGGFPHMVAEDLCLSIKARNAGYLVLFAPDIVCEEEYPVDYLAFKKRHSKWTQGNMEFIKKFTGVIITSPMKWFEKLDIILFTYSLPLTVFFSFYLIINVVALPMLDYSIVYPMWMVVPTALFLLAPMLNDFFFYVRKRRFDYLLQYLFKTSLLYGSMFYTSLRASTKSLFGTSTFIVTPKTGRHIRWRAAVRANLHEIVFVCVLLAATLMLDRSPLPCILMIVSGLASVYLTSMSNHENEEFSHSDR